MKVTLTEPAIVGDYADTSVGTAMFEQIDGWYTRNRLRSPVSGRGPGRRSPRCCAPAPAPSFHARAWARECSKPQTIFQRV